MGDNVSRERSDSEGSSESSAEEFKRELRSVDGMDSSVDGSNPSRRADDQHSSGGWSDRNSHQGSSENDGVDPGRPQQAQERGGALGDTMVPAANPGDSGDSFDDDDDGVGTNHGSSEIESDWAAWASEVMMRAAEAGTDAVAALVTPLKPTVERPRRRRRRRRKEAVRRERREDAGREDSPRPRRRQGAVRGDARARRRSSASSAASSSSRLGPRLGSGSESQSHPHSSDSYTYTSFSASSSSAASSRSGDRGRKEASSRRLGLDGEVGSADRALSATVPTVGHPSAFERVFEDFYTLGTAIGTGYSANVHVAQRVGGDERFAVKVIEKSRMPAEMLTNEVKVLRTVAHRNIVSFVDLFETETKLYLVLELATEGELFDRIVQRGAYPEAEAAALVSTIAKTMQYLHEHGVMHRDMKPENVLFTKLPDGSEIVKLADFGFSTLYDAECTITLDCGSGEYAAPELILRRSCTFASDIWSLGVIIYILLSGFHPFHSDDRVLFMKRIVTADYILTGPEWDAVSEEAKDLVRATLVVDPARRLTAEEICNHPWFRMHLNRAPNTDDRRPRAESDTISASAAVDLTLAENVRDYSRS